MDVLDTGEVEVHEPLIEGELFVADRQYKRGYTCTQMDTFCANRSSDTRGCRSSERQRGRFANQREKQHTFA